MNLNAPEARMLIRSQGPCRWRSNGHLLRCCCASAPHVRTQYAASPSERNVTSIAPQSGAERFPVRCSQRLASDAFLNGLR